MEHKCAYCDDTAKFKCGSCRTHLYCSKEHWKLDWKKHRRECRLFELRKRSDLESKWDASSLTIFPKCYIATRCIKAGQIILEEPAIFQFPNGVSGDSLSLPCVTCWNDILLSNNNGTPPVFNCCCSSCGWPVCSTECEKQAIHAEYECKIFSTYKILYESLIKVASPVTPHHIAEMIKIVRTMAVKVNNPDLWETLAGTVASHTANISRFAATCDSAKEIKAVEDVIGFLLDTFAKAKLDKYVDLLWKCLKVDQMYSPHGYKHQCELQVNQRFPDKFATYLYKVATNFNHDCVPNCTWNIGPAPNFNIRIYAAVPIKRGEVLTVSRIQNESKSHYGTLVRQQLLIKQLGFQCKCKLCCDPTEGDTYMSAFTCQKCRGNNKIAGTKISYLLPINPQNTDPEDQIWRCDGCAGEVSVATNLSRLQEVSKKLDLMFRDQSAFTNGKLDKYCTNIGEKYRNEFLHPNHWLLQDVARCLSSSLMYQNVLATTSKSDIPFDFVAAKTSVLRMIELTVDYLQPILDKVSPGICIQQAYLKSEASYALESLLILNSNCLAELSEESIDELIANQKACIRMRQDMLKYYSRLCPPRGHTSKLFVYPLYWQIRESAKFLHLLQNQQATLKKPKGKTENSESTTATPY